MSTRDVRFDPENTPFDPGAAAFNIQNALQCAAASNLAYEEEAAVRPVVGSWGYTAFRWVQGKRHDIDTQGYVCAGPRAILVAFRGTEKPRDWLTNLEFATVPGPASRVHRGFWEALVAADLKPSPPMDQVREALAQMSKRSEPVWVTGHSLGGALALLCAAQLVLEDNIPVQGIYTFGQPRAGDYGFATAFDKAFEARAFRFVNNNDVVPMVPPVGLILRYWHTEREIYIDSDKRLYAGMPLSRRLAANARGRFQDPAKIAADGIEDHTMNRYVDAIRGAIASGKVPVI